MSNRTLLALIALVAILLLALAGMRAFVGPEDEPIAEGSPAPDEPRAPATPAEPEVGGGVGRIEAPPEPEDGGEGIEPSLAGRVQWSDGRPAPGAEIRCERLQGRWTYPVFSGRAGGDGDFEIAELEPGSPCVLDAWAVDAGGADPPPIGYGRIEAATSPDLDLVLVLREGRVATGRVVDDRGALVEDFAIDSEVVGSDEDEVSLALSGAGIRSEDGAFALAILAEGECTLWAEAPNHTRSAPVRFAIPGKANGLTLVAPRTASVAGTVIDRRGVPVVDARVEASIEAQAGAQPVEPRRLAEEEEVRTDERGRFALLAVDAGVARISAEAEGFAPALSDAIALEPGQRFEGLRIELERGAVLTGEVVDSAGLTAAGYAVDVQRRDGAFWRIETTDEAGRFELRDLPAGSYALESSPPDELWESLFEAGGEPDWEALCASRVVELEPGQVLHVVLGGAPLEAVRVHGVVRASGAPVAGSRILVATRSNEGRALEGETDAEGRYAIPLEEPGEYVFGLCPPAAGTWTSFVEAIPAVGEHRLDFDLPGGAIAGSAYDLAGRPAARAELILAPEPSAHQGSVLTGWGRTVVDAEGAWRFSGLAPGSYWVMAGGGRWGLQVREGIEVEAGGAVEDLDFHLSASGAIRGTVRNAAGEPVPGAVVLVRDPDGRVLNYLLDWEVGPGTDESGSFAAWGLPPGRVLVAASAGYQVTAEPVEVRVEARGEAEVDLRLAAGTVLRVAVRDSRGESIAASVTAADSRGVAHATSAEAHGWGYDLFGGEGGERRIGPLPPGPYRVVARTLGGGLAQERIQLGSGPEQRLELRVR